MLTLIYTNLFVFTNHDEIVDWCILRDFFLLHISPAYNPFFNPIMGSKNTFR